MPPSHLTQSITGIISRTCKSTVWTGSKTAKSLIEELYRSHYEPRVISRGRERGQSGTKKRRVCGNHFDEYKEECRQALTLPQTTSSMATLLQAEDAATSFTHTVGDKYSDWFRSVYKSDRNV
ncbi:hypothetical protein NW762_012607 [Fusarium torreyae]|uniref:Uncharacterized protein n=1 Tax=Fusarium torreyae TaxID=1237075 RepID=A0A9W8RM95_9HYPO|nr:hypothetical protein NW762_012607 [Fusarium torreyae]